VNSSSWFDAARFESLRVGSGVTWGRPVRVLEQAESTSDLGLEAVTSDARTGIVWVAREQTRGRGRRGNAWLAAPGEALLMSTLLRWPAPVQTATGLGLAAGLAVLNACQLRVPHSLGLKWPNDVVLGDAKLAGILIETRPDGNGGVGVVVGVGINVQAREFDAAAGRPTSLALLGANAADLELEGLLVDVLLGLEHLAPRVLTGHLAAVVADVRAVDALAGRRVRIVDAGGEDLLEHERQELVGIACRISDAGDLEVETAGGLRQVSSGHVLFE
jgi:BirA family biotin operon repressor/biotin-[acetyl-CoA-carboxylase] ligase